MRWNRYKDAEDADGELPEAVEPLEFERNLGDRVVLCGNQVKGNEGVLLQAGRFGETQETESLNVAAATAILLSEFKRGY